MLKVNCFLFMWDKVSNLIPNSIKKAGIAKQISDSLVCDEFNLIAKNILGETSSKCRAVYIKSGCLWVAVLSSSVSSELKIYEQDILKAMEERFGPGRVKEIKYMI